MWADAEPGLVSLKEWSNNNQDKTEQGIAFDVKYRFDRKLNQNRESQEQSFRVTSVAVSVLSEQTGGRNGNSWNVPTNFRPEKKKKNKSSKRSQ